MPAASLFTLLSAVATWSAPLPQTYGEISPPCPSTSAQFGFSTLILDFDDDTHPDLAVGAPGEGILYVFLGPWDFQNDPPYSAFVAITAEGISPPSVCPPQPA